MSKPLVFNYKEYEDLRQAYKDLLEENNKQIARIRQMERRLNRAVAAVKRLEAALDKYEAVQ